jgi:small-conductance mechanosensitive channel
MNLLESTFLGNSLQSWGIALGVAFLAHLVLRYLAVAVVGRIVRFSAGTETDLDDIFAAALQRTKGFLLIWFALYLGSLYLTLPSLAVTVLKSAAAIALFLQVGFWLNAGIAGWMTNYRKRRADEDASAVMSMGIVVIIARLVVWSLVVLLSLDNVGVDVTALVAGLGIGGVAVALAAQNILGDLFASVSIAVDKPFVLKDFLIVGDHLGSVEQIGMKTTRLRSLSGEQLVFANADLLNSRIRNYGRMFERRVSFKIGVTYQTPREKLEGIPTILREAVEAQGSDTVRFDRSHFQAYGDFALTFETVYYVLSPDYNVYMDCQQAINLAIHGRFEEEGIEFAYPTQTLFLVEEGSRSSG